MSDPIFLDVIALLNGFAADVSKQLPPECGIAVGLSSPAAPGLPPYAVQGTASPGVGVTPSTIFCIGSCSKTFTATLAAWLQTGCDLPIDTSVATFLNIPDNPAIGSINLFQLATHTSGMPPDGGPPEAAVNLFSGRPVPEGLYDWWSDYPPKKFTPQPGTWTYSDIGFVTLGFAIVGATTAPYPDLLADTITTPLGMANTWGVIPASVPASQIATGYIPGASGPIREPVQNGTDIKSNIVDMLAWTAANLAVLEAGPSLPTPLQQAMGLCVSTQVDPVHDPGGATAKFDMGLAWEIFPAGTMADVTLIAKNGGVSRGGCSAWLAIVPTQPGCAPLAFAMLFNYFGAQSFEPQAAKLLAQISRLLS